jgi:hypothetical protein
MSDDLVRAEVNAVRALKSGVGRYAEQIRDALGHTRREIAAADRKAQEAVERRRSEAQKREQELRQAEAALRQCQENCGGLRQQVTAAAQRLAESKLLLDRARKAAQLTATAQSDLLTVLQNTEATVGEHSSVASSALAGLDAKLAELPKFGVGHAIHNAAVGTVVGIEIFDATMNLGRMTGDALHAANVNMPLRDNSITDMVEHRQDQERDYVAQDFESKKRMSSGEGQEKKP